MEYNNLYNFRNHFRHFINIDNLDFTTGFDDFEVCQLTWSSPINLRIRKHGDEFRTIRMPNILSFVKAVDYYKDLANFEDIDKINPQHSRISADIELGDFTPGIYDKQLSEDFKKLCVYDCLLKLDIKDFYGRIYTHNIKIISDSPLNDSILSGMNNGGTNGLLMGNYLSLYFAENILNDICESLKIKIETTKVDCHFSCFSDDFYFFCNNRDVQRLKKIFAETLEEFEFELNINKSEIYTYEQYNNSNLLVRHWKRIISLANDDKHKKDLARKKELDDICNSCQERYWCKIGDSCKKKLVK